MSGKQSWSGNNDVRTCPKLEKYCSRRSAVVFQLRPPTNSLVSEGVAMPFAGQPSSPNALNKSMH